MNKVLGISIIVVIFIFIIGFLSWFLYINRADAKYNQIFAKILIALIAAIVLIGFELFIPPNSVERKIKVLTLRNKRYTNISEFSNKLLRTNSDFKNGYGLMSRIEIFSSKHLENVEYDAESVGLDNLEYSFWAWLGERYSLHWDIKRDFFEGISGGGGNTSKANNADKETKVYTYQEIRNLLIANQLLPDEHGLFFKVHFPKNTIIQIKIHSKHRREYLIKNKYYTFTITMYSIGTSGLTYTNLGEKIKEALNDKNNEWYSDRFIVNMKCKFSTLRKGSPELKKQKQWIIDIVNEYEHDFEWNNLKPELEKAYGI